MSKDCINKLKKVVFLSIFSCISVFSLGQEISGRVLDNVSEQNLAYVNIGVIGKNVGTVTNQDGTFSIDLMDEYDQDTIRISLIGYLSLEYKVMDFKKLINDSPIIHLEPRSFEIEEVVVSGKKLKTKILGNKTTSRKMSGGFESDDLGSEVGVPVKIKRKPTYIKKFFASIVESKYDTLKFRLNLYSLKNKMPDQPLLNENIIISTTMETGLFEVDLTEYNIVVQDDFFVSLEWIEDLGEDGLQFSMSLLGNPVIHRKTSQGNWEKIGMVGIGFAVEVSY